MKACQAEKGKKEKTGHHFLSICSFEKKKKRKIEKEKNLR